MVGDLESKAISVSNSVDVEVEVEAVFGNRSLLEPVSRNRQN